MSSSDLHVLDIGARYGLHPAFDLLLGRCSIDLVEPDPDEADRLRSQYRDYAQVTIHESAVGRPGEQRRFALREHRGLSGFAEFTPAPDWPAAISGSATQHTLSITARPLSSLIARQSVYLKIDCEGSELEILESGEQSLPHIAGIRCEVNFRPLWTGASLFSEIDRFLSAHNFDFLGYEAPPNSCRSGTLPLPTSTVMPLGGDGIWIARAEESSVESDCVAQALFLYLHGADGLGLERLRLASESQRAELINPTDRSIGQLLYGFVVRHLLRAQRLPYYAQADINRTHFEIFGSALPARQQTFDVIRGAGLALD